MYKLLILSFSGEFKRFLIIDKEKKRLFFFSFLSENSEKANEAFIKIAL